MNLPTADAVLTSIQGAIARTAGSSLLGLYLFGSLAAGDFDADVSDIDLIAVLNAPPNDKLFASLDQMHSEFTDSHPVWRDRIEVIYISAQALAHCRVRKHLLPS